MKKEILLLTTAALALVACGKETEREPMKVAYNVSYALEEGKAVLKSDFNIGVYQQVNAIKTGEFYPVSKIRGGDVLHVTYRDETKMDVLKIEIEFAPILKGLTCHVIPGSNVMDIHGENGPFVHHHIDYAIHANLSVTKVKDLEEGSSLYATYQEDAGQKTLIDVYTFDPRA